MRLSRALRVAPSHADCLHYLLSCTAPTCDTCAFECRNLGIEHVNRKRFMRFLAAGGVEYRVKEGKQDLGTLDATMGALKMDLNKDMQANGD